MRHFVLLLTLASILGTSAQTGLVEFPYNPDADGNDIIGTADLMELLAVFGEEFSEEGLYLNEDSTSAIFFAGSLSYMACFKACSQLPSKWKIFEADDAITFYDELVPSFNSRYCWIRTDFSEPNEGQVVRFSQEYGIRLFQDFGWAPEDGILIQQKDCFCAKQQRPRIEYDLCEGQSTFLDCVDEKVSQGWYPLSGGSEWYQAFWRWAE